MSAVSRLVTLVFLAFGLAVLWAPAASACPHADRAEVEYGSPDGGAPQDRPADPVGGAVPGACTDCCRSCAGLLPVVAAAPERLVVYVRTETGNLPGRAQDVRADILRPPQGA